MILVVLSVSGVRAAETIKPLSLAESIDTALKQSVLIHAAKEGIRGAEAQQKEAFTGFLPKFSTSYSYTRLNEDPYFVFPGCASSDPSRQYDNGDEGQLQLECRGATASICRWRYSGKL